MRRLLIAGSLLLLIAACGDRSSPPAPRTMNRRQVHEAFRREAAAQGLRVIREQPDGTILVDRNGTELTVSLDNLVRDVARDNDPAAISRFVTTIKSSALELPGWTAAADRLRIAAEPSDFKFGDMVHEDVTDAVARVLVYVAPDESRMTWIDASQLRQWHVTPAQAWDAARSNMAKLLAATPIHVEQIEGMKLGMFDSSSAFKASLIFAPNFKKVVAPTVGWPVYVVIPCRDFAYFFRSKNLIERVGTTVVHEYKSSGYPITPDVLRISDSGIQSIGTFPVDGAQQ